GRSRRDSGRIDTLDVVGADRPTEAVQLELPGGRVHDELLDAGQHALADEDLPRLGGRTQAGGEVDDGAERRVLLAALQADPSERRVALRDADPEAEVVTLPRPR